MSATVSGSSSQLPLELGDCMYWQCDGCGTSFMPSAKERRSNKNAKERLCLDCVEASWDCISCGRDTRNLSKRATRLWASGSRRFPSYWANECRRCKVERKIANPTVRKRDAARKFHGHLYCKGCGKAETFVDMNASPNTGCCEQCSRRIQIEVAKFNRMMGFRLADRVELVHLGRLLLRDGSTCSECGVDMDVNRDSRTAKRASVDHMVPVSAAGDHTYENSRPLCERCNRSLGAKH